MRSVCERTGALQRGRRRDRGIPRACQGGRLRIIATDFLTNMVERTRAGRLTQREVTRGRPVRQLCAIPNRTGQIGWPLGKSVKSWMLESSILEGRGRSSRSATSSFLRNVLVSLDPESKRTILERVREEVFRPAGHVFLGPDESTANIHQSPCPLYQGRVHDQSASLSRAALGRAFVKATVRFSLRLESNRQLCCCGPSVSWLSCDGFGDSPRTRQVVTCRAVLRLVGSDRPMLVLPAMLLKKSFSYLRRRQRRSTAQLPM